MSNPSQLGVSFSIKQCRNFSLDSKETLKALISIGFKRFRLMSYWDEHEKKQGSYEFSELDKQLELIHTANGEVSLCVGVRQPRWPESHWPEWALSLGKHQRYDALLKYNEHVIKRYRKHPAVASWQLENEALNRSFGLRGDFSGARLRKEYRILKQLDPKRPVIMSTSNSWGIPLRSPRPDVYGFSWYFTQYENGYKLTKTPRWWPKIRANFITTLLQRPVFIHELQAEPWGPKAIWEMNLDEQDRSMNAQILSRNLDIACNSGLNPIDLWGGEWWYWRLKKHNDNSLWRVIKNANLPG